MAVVLFSSCSAIAGNPPSRSDLGNLGQQFAQRIGKKLEEADLRLSGASELKLKTLQSGVSIPEGEPLILRGFVGKKRLSLLEDIFAMRLHGKMMIALADVSVALELPIIVSGAKGTATGWFRSEGNVFSLDAKTGVVTLGGQPVAADATDISLDGADLMVSVGLLERAFDMEVEYDLSSLNIFFKSGEPLPIELKEQRAHAAKYKASDANQSELPLAEEPYHVFSPPYLDVSIGGNVSRQNSNSPTRKSASWSVIGSGDMMGLTSRTFAAGGWNDMGTGNTINSLRQTFGREDADGRLLGPLGAKSLQFGDINTVNMPLVGGSSQEQGVYLSNRLPGDITTQSRIDINGDGQPGWDVELYNNASLLGLQTVGDDGRYNFPSVFLFEGDNVLRLVFYGPQGERREETRRIVSTASSLKAGESKWEVSLSRSNITTYDANRASQPNDGDPHIVARYERSFGPEASVNAGIVHRTDTDGVIAKEKNYIQVGGAANKLGALLTADAAYDADGEYLVDLLARRSFGSHQTGFELAHASRGFTQGSLTGFAPQYVAQGTFQGPLADSFMGLSSLYYAADAGYSRAHDGNATAQAGGSVSARYKSVGISTGARVSKSAGGSSVVTGVTSLGGYAGRGRWRFSSDYLLSPYDLQAMTANYTYPFSPKLEGIADVTHNKNTDLTSLVLSARWRPDKVAVTPRVAVDTNHQLSVGVNVSFSLADNPYDTGYSMFNRTLTSTGGVAARVFLDKNGNGLYDGDDELLPDVDVRSLQSTGRATTNDNGIAFIPTLPRNIKTDIVVPQESLPDPYYMTATPGLAVRPRPGVTSRIDFPVVVAGEMDGQAGYAVAKGRPPSPRGIRMKLVAPDGTVAQSVPVASDGYYSFSAIRPGVYSLVAETSGYTDTVGSALPKTLVFKAEGSTYFGENVLLTQGDDTRFAFRSVNASPAAKLPGHVVTPEDIEGRRLLVHVGEYRSRLALTLGWYRLKMLSGAWEQHLTLARPVEEETPDAKSATMSILMKPARALSMAQAVEACRALEKHLYKCTIEIVSKYKEATPPVPVPFTSKSADAAKSAGQKPIPAK